MFTRRLFLQGLAATTAILPFMKFTNADTLKSVANLPSNLFLDNKNYIILAPRRAGKTYAMVQGAISYSLNNPKTKTLFYSPNYSMSSHTFEIALDIDGPKRIIGAVDRYIKFANGSDIAFTRPSEIYRGYGHSLTIYDEFAVLEDKIAKDTLLQCKFNNSKTIIATTPTNLGHPCYEIWNDAIKGKNEFIPIRWINPTNPHYKSWVKERFIPLKWS